MNNGYICLYDSGIGGLTTLKAMLSELPNEKFLYFADDKNCPYGNKSKQEIQEIVEKNIDFIINKYKIKMLVFACNTITACCIDECRKKYDFEIVGMEPALKLAMKNSNHKRILALTTNATKEQNRFKKLVSSVGGKVYVIGLSNFADDIENTFVFNKNCNFAYVVEGCERVLRKNKNIDGLVLGCTHYVFLKDALSNRININIYDGNYGVAKRVKRLLESGDKFCDITQRNTKFLLSSGNKYKKKRYIEILNSLKISN